MKPGGSPTACCPATRRSRNFATSGTGPARTPPRTWHGFCPGCPAAGIEEIVAIDLSKDDIGIPVVRVVIPGLEGPDDHHAYVPGKRAAALAGAEP